MSPYAVIALVLILVRAIAELWLSRLNQQHVHAYADEVPSAFRGAIDDATYRRSVNYTLAKSRFGDAVTVFDTALLIAIPFAYDALRFHKVKPLSRQLEIETYTWDVLPDNLKTGDIVDYVCRELDWVRGQLS